MNSESKPNRSRARRRSASEAFILMAITLVAAAVGLGLYMQAGMSLSDAALAGLVLYAGLICMHVLVRRSQAIRYLTYEVDRLESEIVQLIRGAGQPQPLPVKPDQLLASIRPAPQPGPAVSVPPPPPAPRLQPIPQSPQGNEYPDGRQSSDLGIPSQGRPASGPALEISGKPRGAENLSVGGRDEPSVAQSASRQASDPRDQMAQLWSVRPTDVVAGKPKSEFRQRTGDQPKDQSDRHGPELPTGTSAAKAAEAPSVEAKKPVSSAPQRPTPARSQSSEDEPVEADVDVISDMIRIFSEEIASPRKKSSADSASAAPVARETKASPERNKVEEPSEDEAVISASVEALRAAADEMRRPKDPPRPAIERGALPPFKADPNSSAPQPPPLGREHAEAAAMADAIANHKLDVLLEPVVGLADRKARHFDVTLRLRLGEDDSIDPVDYVPMARRAGLLPVVDATRVARAAIVARHMDERNSGGCLFSAITADSLTSERFLEEFAEACRQSPKLRERLIFSITESELRNVSPAQWDTIRQLAESGFRFAIQDLTSLDLDLAETKAAGFAFVRVAAQALLDGLASVDGVLPAADLCQRLAGAGLTLVVCGLENEEQLDSSLAAGVPLGQGRLFGVPRPIRAEALRPARSAAA